jgi:hypothetical protein
MLEHTAYVIVPSKITVHCFPTSISMSVRPITVTRSPLRASDHNQSTQQLFSYLGNLLGQRDDAEQWCSCERANLATAAY